MTLARNIGLLVGACGLVLALTSAVQAGSRVSKWDCPTGQMKNPLTAICEGKYVGNFMFVFPAYEYPGYDTGHRPYRYYSNGYPNRNYHK